MKEFEPDWEQKLLHSPVERGGFTPQLMQRIKARVQKKRSPIRRFAPWIGGLSVAAIALVIFLPMGLNLFHVTPNPILGPSNVPTQAEQPEAIFQKDAGGNLKWWQDHFNSTKSADGKTIAGFMVSLMTRDLGIISNRPAGIDKYFEPSKLDLKKQLAQYDLSSPRAIEAYFSSKQEDPTGTLYTFRVISGTSFPTDRFVGSLGIHVNKESHKVDDLNAGNTVKEQLQSSLWK